MALTGVLLSSGLGTYSLCPSEQPSPTHSFLNYTELLRRLVPMRGNDSMILSNKEKQSLFPFGPICSWASLTWKQSVAFWLAILGSLTVAHFQIIKFSPLSKRILEFSGIIFFVSLIKYSLDQFSCYYISGAQLFY